MSPLPDYIDQVEVCQGNHWRLDCGVPKDEPHRWWFIITIWFSERSSILGSRPFQLDKPEIWVPFSDRVNEYDFATAMLEMLSHPKAPKLAFFDGRREKLQNWLVKYDAAESIGWERPSWDLLDTRGVLLTDLPPERWPWGPPAAHQSCCMLVQKNGAAGSFCDCTASVDRDLTA